MISNSLSYRCHRFRLSGRKKETVQEAGKQKPKPYYKQKRWQFSLPGYTRINTVLFHTSIFTGHYDLQLLFRIHGSVHFVLSTSPFPFVRSKRARKDEKKIAPENKVVYNMANPVLGKSLCSDWFFLGQDFAVRTVSMETIRVFLFWSEAGKFKICNQNSEKKCE